jgi:hypothetical protein
VTFPRGASLRMFLEEATPEECQLALSYLVWPDEAPDPRLVDEYVRRQLVPHSCPKRRQRASNPNRMGTSLEAAQSL